MSTIPYGSRVPYRSVPYRTVPYLRARYGFVTLRTAPCHTVYGTYRPNCTLDQIPISSQPHACRDKLVCLVMQTCCQWEAWTSACRETYTSMLQ